MEQSTEIAAMKEQIELLQRTIAQTEAAARQAFEQSEFAKQQQAAAEAAAAERQKKLATFNQAIVEQARRRTELLRERSETWRERFATWSQEGRELQAEQAKIIEDANILAGLILDAITEVDLRDCFPDGTAASEYVVTALTGALGASPVMPPVAIPAYRFVNVAAGNIVGKVRSVLRIDLERARIANDTNVLRLKL